MSSSTSELSRIVEGACHNVGTRGEKIIPYPYTIEDGSKKLLEILHDFDPEGTLLVSRLGYHFARSKTFTGSRVIDLKGSEYHGMDYLEAEQRVSRKLKSKQISDEKEKSEALSVLSLEYKIHIMLQPKYVLSFVFIFLQGCKKDRELLSWINCFKIRENPFQTTKAALERQSNKVMPQVVIYIALGKTIAERMVRKICEMFSEFDTSEIGLGFPARYSVLVNSFISYAQGGGDVKNRMTESQQQYFLSQEKVHFNLPEQHIDTSTQLDLERLTEVLSKMSYLKNFNFTSISYSFGSKACPEPHVRLGLRLKKDEENPNIPSESARTLIAKLYEKVLKDFGLSPPTIGWNGLFFFLRICLPRDVTLLRSHGFKKNFVTKLFANFLEPSDMQMLIEDIDCEEKSSSEKFELQLTEKTKPIKQKRNASAGQDRERDKAHLSKCSKQDTTKETVVENFSAYRLTRNHRPLAELLAAEKARNLEAEKAKQKNENTEEHKKGPGF